MVEALFTGPSIVFVLTTSLSLFSQLVFVFGFVKLKEPNVRNIFKMFFFANLLFSVSQVTLLVATVIQGFDFRFFLEVNAFFGFLLAILLMITITEAKTFSEKIIQGRIKNAG